LRGGRRGRQGDPGRPADQRLPAAPDRPAQGVDRADGEGDSRTVGWVERSETHHLATRLMGFGLRPQPILRNGAEWLMNDQSSTRPTGARERTLDEIKAEVLRRAGRFSPFESIRPRDAATVMSALVSLDRDHWAAQWCKIGLAYEARATRAPRRALRRASLRRSSCRASTPAASGAIRRRRRRASS